MRIRKSLAGVVLITLGSLAGGLAPATAQAAIGVTNEQCQNGATGTGDCAGSAWVTGNLNPNNSLYREGDFVPFRAQVSGLDPGVNYTLQIGYDAVEKGLHAYDYLGSVDGSEVAAGQRVIPCENVAGTAGQSTCGNAPSTFPVPLDQNTQITHGTQAAGVFSAWGGQLSGAVYAQPTTPIGAGTSGTVARLLDVTFRADGDTVVIAWGGHVASSLDWGGGNTFVSAASGSSFHMRLLQITREGSGPTSTGNRELSLQGTAIAPPPSPFTTSVTPKQLAIDNPVTDTAVVGGRVGAPPSGAVHFFVCFNASTPPDCASGGSELGRGQVVISVTQVATTGTATSSFTPAQPGQYCFRAEYEPDATAPYSPAAHTDPTTECFQATLPPPVLTVVKTCVPVNDPGRFNLIVDSVALLTNAACGASTGPVQKTAGTHTVSETAGSNTSLGDYTSLIGGKCAPDGTVALALGDSATCTITNTRLPAPQSGTLTVNKDCAPAGDGGRFDLHIDEISFADVACGEGTGTVTVAAGEHTVREGAGTNTDLSDYGAQIGGDCATNGTVTVPAGGSAVCTVTNTRKPPAPATLRVDKLCRPSGDDGHFNLTVDGKTLGSGAAEACGGTTGTVQISRGLHVVGETGARGTNLDDYKAVIGGDCTVDGAVTIQPGDQAVCTITNVRADVQPTPATLTVSKICVPADDGGRFNLRIDSTSGPNEPCGGRLGPIVVSPGRHTVSETAGAGTSLDDYTTTIGGDCAADGSVTLRAGQSSTCTITNARPEENTGEIVIKNECEPARANGTFQVQLDRQQFQNMSCGETTGPIETVTGEHLVSEAAPSEASPVAVPEGQPPPATAPTPPGPFVPPARSPFKTVIKGSCSRTGKLKLRRGQRAVCTIVHRLRRPKRPPKPPSDCYTFTLVRKTFIVGVRATVVGRVTLHRRPVMNARVRLHGLGASRTLSTAPNGEVKFVLIFKRRGILKLTVRRQYHCPKPPERDAGVAGGVSPSVTG